MVIQFLVIIILLFLTVFFVPAKGVAMERYSQFASQVKENFKNINLSDGVSKEEAILIAQYDLIKEEDEGKGWGLNIKKPRIEESWLAKGCWSVIFNANLGVKLKSGLKWYAIDVDKKTGEIKVRGWGPS